MLETAKYLKAGLKWKVRKLRKLHFWKVKSQQELKCPYGPCDCKGGEGDKLKVEIKKKVQEEKIINIGIFLYLHNFSFTQGNWSRTTASTACCCRALNISDTGTEVTRGEKHSSKSPPRGFYTWQIKALHEKPRRKGVGQKDIKRMFHFLHETHLCAGGWHKAYAQCWQY